MYVMKVYIYHILVAEDSHRQTNSAPQRQGNLRRQDAPRQLPKINNLVKGHKGEPLQSVPPAPFNNYRTGAGNNQILYAVNFVLLPLHWKQTVSCNPF